MYGKPAERVAIAAGSKAVSAQRASQSSTRLPHPPFSLAFFLLPLLVGCPPSPVLPPTIAQHSPPFIVIGETLLVHLVLHSKYYFTISFFAL